MALNSDTWVPNARTIGLGPVNQGLYDIEGDVPVGLGDILSPLDTLKTLFQNKLFILGAIGAGVFYAHQRGWLKFDTKGGV